MLIDQDVLTVVAPVKADQEQALADALKAAGEDAIHASLHPEATANSGSFRDMKTAHFARWVQLPAARDASGHEFAPQLLLSTCYDKPLAAHVAELVSKGRAALDACFGYCRGYPGPAADVRSISAWLMAHSVPNAAFFRGAPTRSLTQIQQEAELRDSIEAFLDSADWSGKSASEVRRAIQDYVLSREELRWALSQSRRSGGQRLARARDLALGLGRLLGPWPLLPLVISGVIGRGLNLSSRRRSRLAFVSVLVPLTIWLFQLRNHESSEPQTDAISPDLDHLHEVEASEDLWRQNQFTKLVNVKPGAFRAFTLRTILRFVDVACRYWFTRGQLAGIRTIHFANWVYLDGGRRLLFMSNFDGSWENYLGEFIDNGGKGLTALYSNTEFFPRSRWLLWGGVQDEQRYKALVRNAQLSAVWYSAYADLSVENVNNNSRIRTDLWRPMNEGEAESWLHLF